MVVILISQSITVGTINPVFADYVTTTPDGTSIYNNDDGSITYRYSDGRVTTEYPPPNEIKKVTKIPKKISTNPDFTNSVSPVDISITEFRNGTIKQDSSGVDPTVWIYPNGTKVKTERYWLTEGMPFKKEVTHPNGTKVFYTNGKEDFRYARYNLPGGGNVTRYGGGENVTIYPNGLKIHEKPGNSWFLPQTITTLPDGTRVIKNFYTNGTTASKIIYPNGTETPLVQDPPVQTSQRPTQPDSHVEIQIPDWFKSNAIWWRDGLISDTDIINAIESLIIQDVIPLDSFASSHPGIENYGGVEKAGNFVMVPEERKIPIYIKDVFGFWADGLVSDSDISNSLGFLISTNVIRSPGFSEIPGLEIELPSIEYRTGDTDTKVTKLPGLKKFTNVVLKRGFVTQAFNEAFANQLLNIKDYEFKLLTESSDEAWNQYAEHDHDLELMNSAIKLQEASQESQRKVDDALEILQNARKISGHVKKMSQDNGIPVLELEDAITEPLGIIEDIPKINSIDDLKDAYNDAFRTQREAGRQLGKIFDDFTPGDDGIELLYFGTSDRTVGLVWPDSTSKSSPSDWEVISPRVSLSYEVSDIEKNPLISDYSQYTVFSEIDTLNGPWYILEIPIDQEAGFDGQTFTIPNFVHCQGYDCSRTSDYNTPYLDELTKKFEKALTDDLATSLTGFYKKQHNMITDDVSNLIDTINEDLKDGFPNGRNADVDLYGLLPPNVAPLPDPLDEIFAGDLDGYLLIGSTVDEDFLPKNYDNDSEIEDDFPYIEPPYSEPPSDDPMEETVLITVYQFGGQDYPVAQFTLWRWPGECDDAWHNHTPIGHAVNLELTGMSDPDQENCGWGKTSELSPQNIFVPQSMVEVFQSKTGVDPTINEAMLGGDGFEFP